MKISDLRKLPIGTEVCVCAPRRLQDRALWAEKHTLVYVPESGYGLKDNGWRISLESGARGVGVASVFPNGTYNIPHVIPPSCIVSTWEEHEQWMVEYKAKEQKRREVYDRRQEEYTERVGKLKSELDSQGWKEYNDYRISLCTSRYCEVSLDLLETLLSTLVLTGRV